MGPLDSLEASDHEIAVPSVAVAEIADLAAVLEQLLCVPIGGAFLQPYALLFLRLIRTGKSYSVVRWMRGD